MTIHLATFSDESMSCARELCIQSGLAHGAQKTYRFVADPKDPSAAQRGYGFWKWKPGIIQEVMRGTDFSDPIPDGDILIYADAGIEFINNVNYIINRMSHDRPQDDVWLFGNNWEHAHWCKRDVIEAIWPFYERGRLLQGADARMVDDRVVNVFVGGESEQREVNLLELAWERFHKQCQASVIFFRVSDYSRQFVAEWLKWCLFEGGRLIDDSPSRAPNHPEFREHRHDQAILTTLAYREGIKLHWWPAVYNRGGSPEFVYEKLPEYARDTYPTLFHHHRKRDHEWK